MAIAWCFLVSHAVKALVFSLTLPYLTFGVGGYRPPSAETITGLAQFASPK